MNENESEKKQREEILGYTPKKEEKREPISKQIPGIDKYDKTLAQKRNQIEEERMGRLNQARLTAEVLGGMMTLNAGKVADKLGEMIVKYDKEAFVIILALALIKDGAMDILLDFVGIGLIPILGQIPGYFISTVIFLLMWRKGMLKGKIMARVLFLFIGDNIPILEEFPFTTFAVLFAWRGMVKKTRQAQADKEALAHATSDELEEIKKRYEMESD